MPAFPPKDPMGVGSPRSSVLCRHSDSLLIILVLVLSVIANTGSASWCQQRLPRFVVTLVSGIPGSSTPAIPD